VQDVIVEYKQHPSWNKKDQALNIIYRLSLINAVVEDKKLSTHINMYICICTYKYMYIYIYKNMHIYIYIYICIYIYAYINVSMCIYI
jgi:hypothetical protein